MQGETAHNKEMIAASTEFLAYTCALEIQVRRASSCGLALFPVNLECPFPARLLIYGGISSLNLLSIKVMRAPWQQLASPCLPVTFIVT